MRQQTSFEIASCPMSLAMSFQFKRLVAAADILHYHFPWPFADLMHVWHRVKKPSLVTYHSDIVNKGHLKTLYQPLMRAFLKRVNCIVTTSPQMLQSSDGLKDFTDKCHTISLGIDATNYPTPQAQVLEKWQRQFPQRFLLFLGVLRAYKGLHFLIDAVKNTDIQLVIAGSGLLDEALRHQASNAANIHFVGRVSHEDKLALLALSSGVVLPSHLRSEAFGISLLEGMIYAKPLISTELGTGTSYVNEHGITGYVVPPADVTALRVAMLKLYHDAMTAEKMGLASRARYERLFTVEEMVKKYLQVYRSIAF